MIDTIQAAIDHALGEEGSGGGSGHEQEVWQPSSDLAPRPKHGSAVLHSVPPKQRECVELPQTPGPCSERWPLVWMYLSLPDATCLHTDTAK